MGGFYARNYNFSGTGTSSYDTAKAICKGCTEALIRTGWQLDDGVNATIDDINEYNGGSNKRSCWYVLKAKSGSDSPCKLLVYYNYYNRTVPMAQCVPYNGSTSSSYTVGDLCLCMSRGTSFGTDPTDEQTKFIPDDATYLYGDTYGSSYMNSRASSNTAGRKYEYQFVSNGTDVVYMYMRVEDGAGYAFAIGRLFGTLAYENADHYSGSRFGGVCLSAYNGTYSNSSGVLRMFREITDSYFYDGSNAGDFCFIGQSRGVFGGSLNSMMMSAFVDKSLTNTKLCTSYKNGQRRWVPVMFGVFNTDPSNGQTISGSDGFKGWLDTDLFRYVNTDGLSTRQTLNNGNFLHVASGVVIGWDPSNTITLSSINSEIDTRNWDE